MLCLERKQNCRKSCHVYRHFNVSQAGVTFALPRGCKCARLMAAALLQGNWVVVIMLIVTLATMLLSIKTSAPVDSTTAMLLTATEGVQMVIMVLGLIFYNAQVLDRTYTITTVSFKDASWLEGWAPSCLCVIPKGICFQHFSQDLLLV
eukprot:1150138-Pelagomonas_calceolata.AAC.11